MALAYSAFYSFSSAQAQTLTFALECEWSVSGERPATDPDYRVVKTASKINGKWENQYTVEATSRADSKDVFIYELEEASGDEDYLVYKATNDTANKLVWITIQNQLQWATIDTEDGTYECAK